MKMKVVALLCSSALLSSTLAHAAEDQKVDVLLIGGGIMSATLGTYLSELEPDWSMAMVERLDGVAKESSNGWNNAGTGHSALAEMNYTPEKENGEIEIAKAVEINEGFQISRQFWSHQVKQVVLKNPHSFFNSTPHMSFVWGDENVDYLHKRYLALQKSTLFQGMQYSDDPKEIQKWIPLVMDGRDPKQKVAATWMPIGTDVNFGEITRQFVGNLQQKKNFTLDLSTEVRDLKRNPDNSWHVTVADLKNNGEEHSIDAKFVFIGAGGASLPLLQKSGIPEAKNYAGFPVGGSFLVTENPEVASKHLAKVYGKASVGSPPMSVPHLDTRVLDGKRVILFGPFATFSTKFLKEGSLWDLAKSTTVHNIVPMMHVGIDEYPLVEYLAGQLMMSDDDRFKALQEYFPEARKEDWRLWQAGQRVQIIKKDEEKGGVLRLGTEIVSDKEGTLAALLGASPGASTAAPIMVNLLEKAFKDKMATPAWQAKMREIIPTYGKKLNGNPQLTEQEWQMTSQTLQLTPPPMIPQDTPAVVAPASESKVEAKAATDMQL